MLEAGVFHTKFEAAVRCAELQAKRVANQTDISLEKIWVSRRNAK